MASRSVHGHGLSGARRGEPASSIHHRRQAERSKFGLGVHAGWPGGISSHLILYYPDCESLDPSEPAQVEGPAVSELGKQPPERGWVVHCAAIPFSKATKWVRSVEENVWV